MANGWSEERRKKQAEMIRKHRPWEKSTGPKTLQGKERSALNALKHGAYTIQARHIKLALDMNKAFLQHVTMFEDANDEIAQKIAIVKNKKTRRNELMEKP